MTIDPRISFWFTVIAGLISGLLLCGVYFTTLFGAAETARILAWLGIGNVCVNLLNGILHAIPAQKPPTVAAANKFYLGPSS